MKIKKKLTKALALALSAIMVAGAIPMSVHANEAQIEVQSDQFMLADQFYNMGSYEREQLPMDMQFLTYTTATDSIGMTGFYSYYTLPANTNEMVDIVVQFRTPPVVAQRLINEALTVGNRRFLDDEHFIVPAMEGHSRFMLQFGMMEVPFGMEAGNISIVSEHYMLFNGLFMSVPAGMVEMIANLPEVFLVSPAFTYFPMRELQEQELGFGDFRQEAVIELNPIVNEVIYNPVPNDVVPASDLTGADYVPLESFNRAAMDLFQMDYIHGTMNLTGAGVRVGVIDTGIDYRHPVFYPYLVPVQPGGFGHVEHNGNMYTLPGSNFMVEPAGANRQVGRNTSPMENIFGPATGFSNHGTHVAGTVIAMAPDIELYAFRVLNAAPGGSQPANGVLRAIEHSYDLGLDVINLSLGNRVNSPWQSTSYALNLAALAGIISTNAAGNDGMGGNPRAAGRGGWFSLGGGAPTSSLGITVAAGRAGGGIATSRSNHPNSVIDDETVFINMTGRRLDFPVNSFDNQTFDYTWFGLIQPLVAYEGATPMGMPSAAAVGTPAFDTYVELFRTLKLGGGDLNGRVAMITRGSGEFGAMLNLVHRLGASALLIINNEAGGGILAGPGFTATGVTGVDAAHHIPIFSIGLYDARRAFNHEILGAANALPVPREGSMTFGAAEFDPPPPNVITTFSSIGPLGGTNNYQQTGFIPENGALMHIFPDITAPGQNIISANTLGHPTMIDGRPYFMTQGTSMAAPAVAGIAALMVQEFDPNRQHLDTRAIEIKARLMNTATPLYDYEGQYSVLQVGAGLVNPLAALTTPAFAIARHPIPFPDNVGWGIPDSGSITPPTQIGMSTHYMASLSFGHVEIFENQPGTSDIIPVTIHGGSDWNYRVEWHMPTQELLAPSEPANWGPQLTHTVTGVELIVTNTSGNNFDISISHDGALENRGFAQGHLIFYNGTDEIFLIFGAYMDIEESPEPPREMTPITTNVGIWRPIISNYTTDRFNHRDIAADPRSTHWHANVPWVGGAWDSTMVENVLTRSNISGITFGWNDEGGPNRSVRFYVGEYGTALDDKVNIAQFNNVSPNGLAFSGNVVTSVIGGNRWTWNAFPEGLWVDNGTKLEPGVYSLTAVVLDDYWPENNLAMPMGEFIVTDTRPTIEFDQDMFVIPNGASTVAISGIIYSPSIEVAMANDVLGANPLTIVGGALAANMIPTDYGFTSVVMPELNGVMMTLAANNTTGIFGANIPVTQWVPTIVSQRPVQVNAFVRDGNAWSFIGGSFGRNAATHDSLPVVFYVATEEWVDAREDLQDAVAGVLGGHDSLNYTQRSWARLMGVVDVATNVWMAGNASTLAEIQAALNAIEVGLATLLPLESLGDLDAAISHAQTLNQSDFTRGSWVMMQEVLQLAITLAGSEDNAGAIEAITNDLWHSINNLVLAEVMPQLNFEWLNELIERAEVREAIGLGGASRVNWMMFLEALNSARSVRLNPDTTSADINAAANTLYNALARVTPTF